MDPKIVIVSWFAVLGIISFSLAAAALAYEGMNRKKALPGAQAQGDWLFSGFHETVFSILYGKSDAETLCGIGRTEFGRLCRILHRKNDYERIVAMRAEGAACVFLSLVAAWAVSGSIPLALLSFTAGIAGFISLYVLPYSSLKNKAEERLFHVEDDLPRFLSLLEKAMDMPIDKAMLLTASKFRSPLSDDIIDSINKVSLGADGWQETLIDLARAYGLETFSDLVLEVINSYEQGVDIRHLVERKAHEVEQNRLYAVEAHDSKIKTLIYLPIIGLKILPLMVMICLPMLSDFL